MTQALTTLRKRLEELRGAGSRLGRTLRAAAIELDARGKPFPDGLLDELQGYRRDVEELRSRTLQTATEFPPHESAPDSPSLGELSAVLRRAEEQSKRREIDRAVRAAALATLTRVASIASRDDQSFAPVAEIRSAAESMRSQIAAAPELDLPESVEAIVSGKHPLVSLLTLVEGDEGIDDDRWAALLDDVTQNFGRPLAAAVARGRLHCVSRPASVAENPKPSSTPKPPRNESPPAAHPAEIAPVVPVPPTPGPAQSPARAPDVVTPQVAVDVSPVPPQRSPLDRNPASGESPRIPVARAGVDRPGRTPRRDEPKAAEPRSPEKPVAPRIDLDDTASDEKEGTSRQGAVIMRSASAPKTTASSSKTLAGTTRVGGRRAQPIPVLAQSAIEAAGQERNRLISNLIWRLALEGRLGIACHLARCLERRSDVEVQFIPSTLLHALCLAPHVQFPQGETAHRLVEDFSRLRFMQGPRNDAEWAVAWQLLLTAAALRPALLAPPCGAAAVLHNMRMIEGLSRLYNYTHRIAIFADAGRPLDVNTFKRARSEQAWESELEQLLAEVEAWCGQTPVRRVRYAATTHCFLRSHWSVSRGSSSTETHSRALWRIWQSTMDVLHSMLEPVRQNRLEDLERVRAEADRLSDPAEIDRLTSGAQIGRHAGIAVDAGARENLRLIISEATGLARRWLRIQDTPPERRTPTVPRHAEELLEERRSVQLRDEVVSRQDAVLKELKAVSERYTSLPIVTAIACCCRAVEQIRRLFDPDEPVATNESDPRLLFNSELLRIPSLSLNDAWEPEVSANELENDILQLLTRGAPDWKAAFDARCDEGDHEATRRLLELPVWLDPGQQSQLSAVREQKLELCRRKLLRDVEQTRARVGEAFQRGLIQDRDRDEFDAGINAVESSCRATQRFAGSHRRLSEIRESLERRRQYEIEKIRQRIEMLDLKDENPLSARIDAAINDGNLASANRYIEMAETGDDRLKHE
ncbi:MAG: hypothetical protein IT428_19960 [Planctomycetaceae bacterium]|nr:hypothetical protein [Planctomycetaceae bacterium]